MSQKSATTNPSPTVTMAMANLANNNLTENVLSALECPVCLEYCYAPIYQCKNGHLICKTCYDEMDKCATCRTRLSSSSKIRNLAVEKIAEEVEIPCSNNGNGCLARMKMKEVKMHGFDCSFGSNTYCVHVLREGRNSPCQVKTHYADLLTHLSEDHGIRGARNNQIVVHQIRKKPASIFSPLYIQCFEKIFILKTTLLSKVSITWKVMLIGSSKSAKDYRVTIRLYRDTDNEMDPRMEWQGMVGGIEPEDRPKDQEFTITQSTLKTFSHSSEDRGLDWKLKVTMKEAVEAEIGSQPTNVSAIENIAGEPPQQVESSDTSASSDSSTFSDSTESEMEVEQINISLYGSDAD